MEQFNKEKAIRSIKEEGLMSNKNVIIIGREDKLNTKEYLIPNILNKAEKEESMIITGDCKEYKLTLEHLRSDGYHIEIFDSLFNKNQIKIKEFKEKKTIYFIKVEEGEFEEKLKISILVESLIKKLLEFENEDKYKPVTLFLDRLDNISTIRNFEKYIRIARTKNINFIMTVKAITLMPYSKEKIDGILANCATEVFTSKNNIQTEAYIKENIGNSNLDEIFKSNLEGIILMSNKGPIVANHNQISIMTQLIQNIK